MVSHSIMRPASIVMSAGQKYSRFNLHPTILFSIGKVCFSLKIGGVSCKMRVFCSRLRHMVLASTQMTRSRDIRYTCFSWNWFVLLWTVKTISWAKKSALKVKIGQIVHNTVLFLKQSRHLGYPDYVICYGRSKSVWDAGIGFQASVI